MSLRGVADREDNCAIVAIDPFRWKAYRASGWWSRAIRKREGNRPDRRLAPEEAATKAHKAFLRDHVRYVGSAHHKLRPGDYGLVPPVNPRASKSVCDDRRLVVLEEAQKLLLRGVEFGMFSKCDIGQTPKYIWAVDEDNQVYEAKTDPRQRDGYHGYRVGEDEAVHRRYVLDEWRRRCRTV